MEISASSFHRILTLSLGSFASALGTAPNLDEAHHLDLAE